MTLVTGGTGFIGSHLLERSPRSARRVRALVRRARRRCPRASKPSRAIWSPARAGRRSARRRYRDPSGRRHQSAARRGLLRGQRARHAQPGAGASPGRAHPLRPRQFAGRDRPEPGRAPARRRRRRRIRRSHYGKSKLEAERAVRELTPEAVIVRPPVVYGPRDTDVFQASEIDLARPGAGDRRRRALVQRDLCRRTWWKAFSPRARSPRAPGATISWPIPSRSPGANSARVAAAHHAAHAARACTIPLPLAMAIGRVRRGGRAHHRQARHHLPREDRRSPLSAFWTCDTRGPPRNWASPRHLDRSRPGRDARLVQGGRMADVLKPRPTDRASGRSIR